MAIVDLDRPARRRSAGHDRGFIAAVVLASGVFALAVWITRPATAPARRASQVTDLAITTALAVPRGVVMYPLALPAGVSDVDLAAMPDRLANEAAPSTWRRVVTVRGVLGVASAEGPAVVAWTEHGIAYWLASPTRSTEELIQIADELR